MKDSNFKINKPPLWVRCCSRLIDYLLLYLGISLSTFLLPFYFDDLFYILLALFTPLLGMLIEALCVAKWGTTLGRKICGWRAHDTSAIKSCRRWIGVGIAALLGIATCFLPTFKDYLRKAQGYHQTSLPGWVQYTAPEGFSCDFPSPPQLEVKQLDIPKAPRALDYKEYKSLQEEGVSYAISYLPLPAKFRLYGSNTILKAALNLIPENGAQTKELGKKLLYHRKYPALDFHLKNGEEEVVGRLILMEGTLFKLTVMHPNQPLQEIHAETFLNSFRK